MAYIVFVNPGILSEAGMPVPAVAAATCLSAAIGCILMGLIANYPIALAPGMGLNAYFAFTVVKGMGVPWRTALGCVFISGCVFLLLTAAGIRQLIVNAIPRELFASVAAGVGLFVAFVGLRDAGIIVPNAATVVGMGNLRAPQTALACVCLLTIAVLQAWRVRTAMLLGILGTTAAGFALGIVKWHPVHYRMQDLTATAFQLDIRGALHLGGSFGAGLLEVVFVFLFVDLFDNVGTLVAVTKKAGLVNPDGEIPRLNRILFADATATLAGSMAGTSTVVSYIESAAGVAVGGRTGIASIVTGLFFLDGSVCGPAGSQHSYRGDCAGVDPGGRLDDLCRHRDRMGRPHGGGAGISNPDHHSTHVFDCQWLGLRHHFLCRAAAIAGKANAAGLDAVCAGGAVYPALHLHGEKLSGRRGKLWQRLTGLVRCCA